MENFDLGKTITGFTAGRKVFSRYTLKRVLGRGGMGVVWLARDESLDTDVALKFLPDAVANDASAVNDLKRETRRSLQLTHPNLVRIHDFLQDANAAAVSMEFVDGATLAQLRVEKAAQMFEVAELIGWMRQFCGALAYAHETAQLVHRDLKPANVMVSTKGELKVTDFGISATVADSATRISNVAATSGTLVYMSPQQMMGEKPAATDDLYSCGAMLYELLTGKPPFFSGNVALQVQSKVPVRMAQRRSELGVSGAPIPAAWEAAVAACLAKNAADRPQSARDLAERLGLAEGTDGRAAAARRASKPAQSAPPPPPIPPSTPLPAARPNRTLWGVGAALAVVLLGGGLWWYFAKYLPEAQRLANARGGLVIRTEPEGAEVRVGGMALEKSPLTIKEMRLGKYPVRIRLAGYDPVDRELEVRENEFSDPGVIKLVEERGQIAVNSVPAGLPFRVESDTLVLGGRSEEPRSGLTPATVDKLLAGTYRVVVQRAGWPEAVSPQRVARGTTAEAKAVFSQGVVAIESAPSGQRVFIDGTEAGVTPVRVEASPERHVVRVLRPGWPEFRQEVTVAVDQTSNVTANFVAGKLTIESDPAGVPFEIEGWKGPGSTGTTPDSADLTVGTHRILYRVPGWPVMPVDATVAEGAQTTRADLRGASVRIESEPTQAEVWWPDGRRAGVTPLTLENIAPTAHALVLKKPLYQDTPLNIALRPTEVKSVRSVLPEAMEEPRFQAELAQVRQKAGGGALTVGDWQSFLRRWGVADGLPFSDFSWDGGRQKPTAIGLGNVTGLRAKVASASAVRYAWSTGTRRHELSDQPELRSILTAQFSVYAEIGPGRLADEPLYSTKIYEERAKTPSGYLYAGSNHRDSDGYHEKRETLSWSSYFIVAEDLTPTYVFLVTTKGWDYYHDYISNTFTADQDYTDGTAWVRVSLMVGRGGKLAKTDLGSVRLRIIPAKESRSDGGAKRFYRIEFSDSAISSEKGYVDGAMQVAERQLLDRAIASGALERNELLPRNVTWEAANRRFVYKPEFSGLGKADFEQLLLKHPPGPLFAFMQRYWK